MIKTVVALAAGSIIGLGMFQQDSDAPQEKEVEQKVEVTADEAGNLSLAVLGDHKEPIVIKLVETLAELEMEMAEVETSFGEKHPKMIQLKGKADVLNKLIKEITVSGVLEANEFREFQEAEAAEAIVIAEVEEAKRIEAEAERKAEGLYTLRFESDKPAGIRERKANTLLGSRIGVAGAPHVAVFPNSSGQHSFFSVGKAGPDPMAGYAEKWREASEEEREEIMQKMRDVAAKQFDEEMERREKELAEIKQRYERLQGLMDRRSEKRDDIIQHYLENLQLEWEGLGFPKQSWRGSGVHFQNFAPRFPNLSTAHATEFYFDGKDVEVATPPKAPSAPKPRKQ